MELWYSFRFEYTGKGMQSLLLHGLQPLSSALTGS